MILIKRERFFKLFMIASTLISPLFLNILGGIGLVANAATNYGDGLLTSAHRNYLTVTGVCMLVSSAFMCAAALLCLKRSGRAAIITDIFGFLLCIISLILLICFTEGLSDGMLVPLRQKYLLRHLPTLIPFALIMWLSVKVNNTEKKENVDKTNKTEKKSIFD